ncbi:hypothetical protein NU08_1818 [Flavobacterium anhuiense]|uniref:Uncharacterized protein n=1 Tax=Flavobacterium anhuiense TaxID=459526 RepID=A0A444VZB3_9FLAO|nr:hypothetical protein NU08_1818 [Flavobacterium anhuiense]
MGKIASRGDYSKLLKKSSADCADFADYTNQKKLLYQRNLPEKKERR